MDASRGSWEIVCSLRLLGVPAFALSLLKLCSSTIIHGFTDDTFGNPTSGPFCSTSSLFE